ATSRVRVATCASSSSASGRATTRRWRWSSSWTGRRRKARRRKGADGEYARVAPRVATSRAARPAFSCSRDGRLRLRPARTRRSRDLVPAADDPRDLAARVQPRCARDAERARMARQRQRLLEGALVARAEHREVVRADDLQLRRISDEIGIAHADEAAGRIAHDLLHRAIRQLVPAFDVLGENDIGGRIDDGHQQSPRLLQRRRRTDTLAEILDDGNAMQRLTGLGARQREAYACRKGRIVLAAHRLLEVNGLGRAFDELPVRTRVIEPVRPRQQVDERGALELLGRITGDVAPSAIGPHEARAVELACGLRGFGLVENLAEFVLALAHVALELAPSTMIAPHRDIQHREPQQ